MPFDLAYRPVDVTAALARYGKLICASAAQYWEGRKDTVEVPGRGRRERVRLLIVNGQIRRMHPVWEVVLRGLIAHLDRTKFEVFVYHTSAEADDETEWARSQVDRFVHGVRSTQSWLAQVARDQPDVIFFPEVGMDTATCALAALRLAPLQIAGWGHPVTTGLAHRGLVCLRGVAGRTGGRAALLRKAHPAAGNRCLYRNEAAGIRAVAGSHAWLGWCGPILAMPSTYQVRSCRRCAVGSNRAGGRLPANSG